MAEDDVGQQITSDRMQDFIFWRELAEVYLLLDHLSGRSNKSLAAAIGDGKDDEGRKWITDICAIGWPPKGTAVEQNEQAATLLLAKDKLNSAAKPANSASIAFTLLVAGDDDAAAKRRRHRRGLLARMCDALLGRCKKGQRDSAVAPATNAPVVAPPPPPGGGPPVSPGRIWGGEAPSRLSLARQAYPGLVSTAAKFNFEIKAIILLLFFWLIFTCALSWNIAAGQAVLARLDNLETSKVAIQKRISDAEIEEFKHSVPDGGATPTAAQQGTAVAAAKPLVQRYCERARILPPLDRGGVKIEQFNDVTQRQICDQLADLRISYANGREDLADWLAPWRWVKGLSHVVCRGRCLTDSTIAVPADAVNEQQWASVLLQVLATAVLPLCYGFLGAGAAVVRNIWGKMRDSLLSPRDLTLSLGQLALGAVIGACIGLFVTPSGANAQGAALTGAVTLTPSALSFIAGFGVEGVFVALESFIKRVFNIPEPKP